jgi:UDP-3-O-[3-hydroxymyristoyl] glucosamine N-acyltransferase
VTHSIHRTPRDLAISLKGDLIPAERSPFTLDSPLRNVCPPEKASVSDVVILMQIRWREAMLASAAGLCVCEKKIWEQLSQQTQKQMTDTKHVIVVTDGRQAFISLLKAFYPEQPLVAGIHSSAIIETTDYHPRIQIGALASIGENTQIAEGTRIGAQACIGKNVQVGKDCQIGERVVLCDGVSLGERVIVHPGAIIGADGYGFYQMAPHGPHQKIPQVGSVVIENDVEIGANVTIDRGALGNTRIGEGSKIDNLVHIAHNVQIGKRCLIIAQVGISGSTEIGNDVILAGQTGVAGHLQVGDGVIASGKTGITRSIPAGQHVSGHPAMEHRAYLRWQAALKQWPRWWEKLKRQ